MASNLTADDLQDPLAVSLARVIAAANRSARDAGVDPSDALINITQLLVDGELMWRVNYGPRDYVGRRGGDVIVDVDPRGASVTRVLRGQ
jgi:hypothetical protein